MRKTIIIIGICVFLFSTNVLTAKNINAGQTNKITEIKYINKYSINGPPDWATGEFNGTWGLSALGLPALELGWIEGYFSVLGIFGRIEGDFAEWKNNEPTAYLSCFVIGYFMIGAIGDYINPTNSTYFVGLGSPNENGEFYYRINLIVGPSWYMMGTWREI